MDLDRRIMDVDNAVDAARNGLAHVVLLGFANTIGFEVGRSRRIKRHDNTALQNRLGRIGGIGNGSGLRHVHRGGKGRKRRLRLCREYSSEYCRGKKRSKNTPYSFHVSESVP